MDQGLGGIDQECLLERLDGQTDSPGAFVTPPHGKPYLDLVGGHLGSLPQGHQGLVVLPQCPQRFTPKVQSVDAEAGRITQSLQRIQRMLRHTEFQVPLGLTLRAPQMDSIACSHRLPASQKTDSSKAERTSPQTKEPTSTLITVTTLQL